MHSFIVHLIRHPKDFWAGVLYIVLGGTAFLIALDYAMGSAGRMGPGYFPRALGLILVGIGVLLVLRGLRTDGEKIAFPTFKPVIIVLFSVLVFGLIVNHVGLVLGTAVLVLISSTASHEYRWKESIIASVALAIFVLVAFRYGLDLQMPTWPAMFNR